MEETTMSSRGQIVIPKSLREAGGIKEGQRFVIEEIEGAFLVMPIPKDPVKALRGLAKGVLRGSSVKLVRELREEWR